MADLTADSPIRLMGEAKTERFKVDTSVARTFYKGQAAIIDQSVDTTHIAQFVDAVVVAVTDVFVGIAAEGKTFALSANEDESWLECYVSPTIVGFPSAVFTDADLGKDVTMSDSGTLSTTTLANPKIGKLHKVRDGYAFVELITPNVCSGAGA